MSDRAVASLVLPLRLGGCLPVTASCFELLCQVAVNGAFALILDFAAGSRQQTDLADRGVSLPDKNHKFCG